MLYFVLFYWLRVSGFFVMCVINCDYYVLVFKLCYIWDGSLNLCILDCVYCDWVIDDSIGVIVKNCIFLELLLLKRCLNV